MDYSLHPLGICSREKSGKPEINVRDFPNNRVTHESSTKGLSWLPLPGRKKVRRRQWAHKGTKVGLHQSCSFQFLGDLDFIRPPLALFNHRSHACRAKGGKGRTSRRQICPYPQITHHPSLVQGRGKGLPMEDHFVCEQDSFCCTNHIWSTSSHQPQKAQDKTLTLLNRRCYSSHQAQQANKGSQCPSSSSALLLKLFTNPFGEKGLMLQLYSLQCFTFSHTIFHPLLRAGHRTGQTVLTQETGTQPYTGFKPRN